jgi:GT2 family glycosyltransferase
MAVYDTVLNKRQRFTAATLESLGRTVNWDRHRLIVVDNASCEATHDIYKHFQKQYPVEVIQNKTNLGQTKATNKAWQRRKTGECAAKIDNDVVIYSRRWADAMEDVFSRDPQIGICGLKRKDLMECPWHENPYFRSEIRMLPHEPGQRWLVVEQAWHVMGTCFGFSALMLQKFGYLNQPNSLYGFDDSLAAARAEALGFQRVFLCGVEIDHIDPGGDWYTKWKMRHAGEHMDTFNRMKQEYLNGQRNPYYDGGFDED